MEKKSALKVAIIFISIICSPNIWALDPYKAVTQYTIQQWGDENGLPQNSVHAILQTSDGYIWVGTEEGLARFDGMTFTVFDVNNTPAVTTLSVRCLFEDSSKKLWVAVVGGGLLVHKNGKFERFGKSEELTNLDIYAIYEDKKRGIWFGTGQEGLWRYSPATGHFTVYKTNIGLPVNSIKTIYGDSKENLWIGTTTGLSCLKDNRFYNYIPGAQQSGIDNREKEMINVVYEDSRKNLWIGSVKGLYRQQAGKFIKYKINEKESTFNIVDIYEDSDKNLWLATRYSGLIRFYSDTFSLLEKKDGLKGNWVNCITEDKEGGLWVGMAYGGLIRLKDDKLTTITTTEGLSDDIVFSIFQCSKGYIWIGTNNGLNRFKDGKFKHYTTKNGLTHNSVDTINEDRHNVIWVGTDKGLNRLPHAEADQFEGTSYLKEIKDHYIPAILEDSRGYLWVGTLRGAVRIKSNNVERFTEKDGLATGYINYIHEDRWGNIWFSTLRGGITRYKDGRFKVFNKEHGLMAQSLNCIYEDDDGVLWLGSQKGLIRYKDGSFATIAQKDGLFNNNIFQILEDEESNFWMSCNKGIFRVSKLDLHGFADGKQNLVKSVIYGKSDGMRNIECNGGYRSAGTKTSDHKLWFPTMEGVVIIDPEQLKTNTIPPPVFIEGFSVDNTIVDLNNSITLKPNIKRIEIRFTALSFSNPRKLKFKFILDGYDEDWVNSGNSRVTNYTNLDGGTYRFRVTACNNDGIWNNTGTSIIFHIMPIWKTWGFILPAIIIGATLFYMFFLISRKYIRLSLFWKSRTLLGNYKLLEKIGSGGMGTVFKAKCLIDKKELVAIKILKDEHFKEEVSRKRFKREALIIDQLEHPNIVKVIERGSSKQSMFIAMELLEGTSLAEKIATDREISIIVSLHIMVQITNAVVKIHSKNIVHRDLKPGNIMLIKRGDDPNFVKLLDFGLAKTHSNTQLTQTGILLGTIYYMAPEQLTGSNYSSATDIYALGVIFHEILTGKNPFSGTNSIETLGLIIGRSSIQPIDSRTDIPTLLNKIISKMMTKEAASRPGIGEVKETLQHIQLEMN
jgi:ligand-binding sensor domain-containing protein/tRNA A-37 threonylcarbamoyl transferase component Bud32